MLETVLPGIPLASAMAKGVRAVQAGGASAAPAAHAARHRAPAKLTLCDVWVQESYILVTIGTTGIKKLTCAVQWLMVRELFKLAEHAQRQQPKPPGTGRAAQWYFFGVAAFWVYLRFIQNQLTVEITSNATLAHLFGWVLKKHTIIAFSLYTAGAPPEFVPIDILGDSLHAPAVRVLECCSGMSACIHTSFQPLTAEQGSPVNYRKVLAGYSAHRSCACIWSRTAKSLKGEASACIPVSTSACESTCVGAALSMYATPSVEANKAARRRRLSLMLESGRVGAACARVLLPAS